MNIQKWLELFKKYWEEKDPEKVLSLFTQDIIYFEDPSTQLTFEELQSEWGKITKQENLKLSFKVILSNKNTHTITWNAKVRLKNMQARTSSR